MDKIAFANERDFSIEPNCEYDEVVEKLNSVLLIDPQVQQKHMLQPQKQLELDAFGKELLLAII